MMRLPAVLRRLHERRDGVALIEFAISLPVLLLLYVGGFQLCYAVSVYRKVTQSSRTIADLTTQYTSVTDQDLQDILGSAKYVMAPYKISMTKAIVTQVKISKSLKSTVDWSKGLNTDGLQKNKDYNLPLSIRQPDTYLVVADVSYLYQPTFAGKMIGSIPLRETIIMSPRASEAVELKK